MATPIFIWNDSLKTFASEVKRLRLARDLTQAEVASALGVTQGHIANMEAGRASLSTDKLLSLAELLKADFKELAKLMSSPSAAALKPIPLPKYRTVVVVGTVGAGPACDEPLQGVFASVLATVKGEVVGYQVVGDSMREHLIGNGDVVVVREVTEPSPGDMVVAWVEDKGMVLKEFMRDDEGWLLKSRGWRHRLGPNDKLYGVYVGMSRDGLIRRH